MPEVAQAGCKMLSTYKETWAQAQRIDDQPSKIEQLSLLR